MNQRVFLLLLFLAFSGGCGENLPHFDGGFRIAKAYHRSYGLIDSTNQLIVGGPNSEGSIVKCMKNGDALLLITENGTFTFDLKKNNLVKIDVDLMLASERIEFERNMIFSIGQ